MDAIPQPDHRQTEQQIRAVLINGIVEATARTNAAAQAFTAIIDQSPSSFSPDSAKRIRNASRELSSARREMMKAHKRLNDFVSRGIVPEDLKRSG